LDTGHRLTMSAARRSYAMCLQKRARSQSPAGFARWLLPLNHNVRCSPMRWLRMVLMLLAVGGVDDASGAAPEHSFTGDPIDEHEQVALINALRYHRGPVFVRLHDIDHDGANDIIYLTRTGIVGVLFRRGTSYANHMRNLSLRAAVGNEEPMLIFIDGLDPRYSDIVVHVPKECFLVYVSWKRFEDSNLLLDYERFQCQSGESHEPYLAKRDDCLKSGGSWGPQGRGRYGGCVYRTSDAEKPCRDRSDCTARCIYVGPPVAQGTEVTGQCQSSTQGFGCFQLVRDGKYFGRLCAD